MTDTQAFEEIAGILGATTPGEAVQRVRDLTAIKRLVGVDNAGRLVVTPGLTVKQISQLVVALEGLTIGS